MSKKHTFNSPILVPILDIAVAIVLAVGGGALWFQSRGTAAVAASLEALRHESAVNLAELRRAHSHLTAAEQEAAHLQAECEAQSEYNRFLMDRIQEEQQALTETWEAQRPLVESAARLQAEIRDLRDRARAYRTDAIETDWKIDSQRAEVMALQLQVQERRQVLEATGRQADQARVEGSNRAALEPRMLANHLRGQ